MSSKPHFPILDGLRGVAAILVVIFHLLEANFPKMADHPMHHGYLAVDFFYLLSGFVVGYAYDDRWGAMTRRNFFKIRLVRLHPLVILGTLIGAICFWFDPFPMGREPVGLAMLGLTALAGMLLLPGPDIRGWGETHPLDGPAWSLLQEYIANLLYALFGYKMGKSGLWVLVILAAAALVAAAIWHGDVATGWSYETIWFASIRMLYPFFAGLLLYRIGRLIRIPAAFSLCSLGLAILFFMPVFPINGLYDAACIIFLFPLIVAAGAGGQVSGYWARICKFSGDISYPIYILHYPFIYMYTGWIVENKPEPVRIIWVATGLFFFFILLAYAALKWYDEPVRRWLKKNWLRTS